MTNVLENIIKDKKERLLKIKQEKSLDFIEKKIKNLNFLELVFVILIIFSLQKL